MEKFDVNPRDGKLTIKAPLDREMVGILFINKHT
jgi:hypothetical protein